MVDLRTRGSGRLTLDGRAADGDSMSMFPRVARGFTTNFETGRGGRPARPLPLARALADVSSTLPACARVFWRAVREETMSIQRARKQSRKGRPSVGFLVTG